MKRSFALLTVMLAAGVLQLSAAPLKVVKTESFRPESRPGAVFESKNNIFSVKLDEKNGDFGKWMATYTLPDGAKACQFRIRHDADKDAVAKGLIVCTASWLDKAGEPIRTSYLAPGKDKVFSAVLRRPEGAVQARISMGVRYYFKEVKFTDVLCDTVAVPSRKVRIVTAKVTPAGYGKATCADNEDRMELIFRDLERLKEKPDLVVFPETLLTRWVRNLGLGMGAQPIPGPHTAWAAAWAKKLNTNVVISLRELADGRYYASAAVIDRTGKLVGVYRKAQFTVGEYEWGMDWGSDLPVFELDFGKIGALICWDLWFPEAVRALRLRGAEIITYPIASTGRTYFGRMWTTRAMENGLVLATSISGGESCPAQIITPDGVVRDEAYYSQTYAITTVDLDDLPVYEENMGQKGTLDIRSARIAERNPALYRQLSDLD